MSDIETRGRASAAAPAVATGAEPARTAAVAKPAPRDHEGSFGRALAGGREARAMTQAEVAARLRLHPRQVKAIEDEDLAALPEGPFVRGYLRNYARLVDLPAEPLLLLLNARLRPTEPLRADGQGSKAVSPIQRVPREPVSGRLVIGGALVALAVFAAFGWWTMRAGQQQEAGAGTEAGPATPAAQSSPAAAAPHLQEFAKAMKIDSSLGLAYFHAGVAYLQKGLLDEAADILEKGKKMFAPPGWMEGVQGLIYAKKGDRKNAVRLLEGAIETKKTVKNVSSPSLALLGGTGESRPGPRIPGQGI